MNVSTILGILQIVMQELPGAITTITQLRDIATKVYSTVNGGRVPTDAEMDQLAAEIDILVAEALKPLQRE